MKVVTHTDLDGICCAALFIRKFGFDIDIIYASVNETKDLTLSGIHVDYTCDLPKVGSSINIDHHKTNYENLIETNQLKEEDWVDPNESSATDIVFKYLKLEDDYISREIRELGHLADIAMLPEIYRPLDIVLNMNSDNKKVLREISNTLANYGSKIVSSDWLKNEYEKVQEEFTKTNNTIKNFLVKVSSFPRILILDTRHEIPGKLAKEVIKPIFEQGVAVLGILYSKSSNDPNRISFRVNKSEQNHYDVSQIAKTFGGGGHKMAAACSLKPTDIPDRLVNKLKSIARYDDRIEYMKI